MQAVTTIGLDIAKSVFQVHGIDAAGNVLIRRQDSAISVHLTTEAEIDEFVDDALAELGEIRIDAKKALAATDSS